MVGDDVWTFQPATYLTVDAYPNPFNSTTNVRYSLSKPGEVSLDIYDLLGRHVVSLFTGRQSQGTHEVMFDASDLASGSYFLRLEADKHSVNRKLILVK
ncbi:hypothetical protein BMS3Bbin04_00230 [bacterium BMS3Bbin04]|nr:hypothetical protein BMS3Bbin04_00230 [bacterium BMS3Bbin04]